MFVCLGPVAVGETSELAPFLSKELFEVYAPTECVYCKSCTCHDNTIKSNATFR